MPKHTKTRLPAFVIDWYKTTYPKQSEGLDDDELEKDIRYELRGAYWDPKKKNLEWEQVQDQFLQENKYSNTFTIVLRHKATNRFVRFFDHSLPYGLSEYDTSVAWENAGYCDIIEVFPIHVWKTEYLDRKEHAKHEAKARKHRNAKSQNLKGQ